MTTPVKLTAAQRRALREFSDGRPAWLVDPRQQDLISLGFIERCKVRAFGYRPDDPSPVLTYYTITPAGRAALDGAS